MEDYESPVSVEQSQAMQDTPSQEDYESDVSVERRKITRNTPLTKVPVCCPVTLSGIVRLYPPGLPLRLTKLTLNDRAVANPVPWGPPPSTLGTTPSTLGATP